MLLLVGPVGLLAGWRYSDVRTVLLSADPNHGLPQYLEGCGSAVEMVVPSPAHRLRLHSPSCWAPTLLL